MNANAEDQLFNFYGFGGPAATYQNWPKLSLSDLIDGEEVLLSGSILPAGATPMGSRNSVICYMVLHMREDVGNEYQELMIGDDFDIEVRAIQASYE